MDASELLAVPTEEVVRAQREMSIVTAALADLWPRPQWPEMIATRCDEPFVFAHAQGIAQMAARDGLPKVPILVLRDGEEGSAAASWNEFVDSLSQVDEFVEAKVIIGKEPTINSVTDTTIAFETAKEIGAIRILFVFTAWSAARGTLTVIRQHERLMPPFTSPVTERRLEPAPRSRFDVAIAQRPCREDYPISWSKIKQLFDLEARKIAAYQAKGDAASLKDFWLWIEKRRQRG